MAQVRLIINVSDETQSHSNGLSGIFTVPAKQAGEQFGLLVVYPSREIQDVGNNSKAIHWPKPTTIAQDIIGRSDAAAHTPGSLGTKEKWGLLLCEAEPDMPRELMMAYEAEIDFLNDNIPDYRMKKDKKLGITVAINNDPAELQQKKAELSDTVAELKADFEKECRKLVQKAEIRKAQNHLQNEDQRLVSEGDAIWAGPEGGRGNVNEIHKRACKRLGQRRPWCYVAEQLVPCPGCGDMIKENILSCPHCAGWLDEGIEELRIMEPKKRTLKMYPNRFEAEPVGATTGKK